MVELIFPEMTQEDLAYALAVLESCKQESAEAYGFRYPYFTPGGAYGAQWWQLDSSLALSGYKWMDRRFAETALWNFIESQKENGRICLWGADIIPGKVAGRNFPEQTENVSSLPKLFDVAYHVMRGSTDHALKVATYGMLKRYLDWWYSDRFDEETGLFSAVFEETFIPYLGSAGEYAAVDTNTELYVGCHVTALLARELGDEETASKLEQKKNALRERIQTCLWNEEKGAFYPYLLREKRHGDRLMASTFTPLRFGIATPSQQKRLINLLRDHEHFNWDGFALTSVSKKDPAFTVTEGVYQGNASWSGSVWTLINETVVRGLVDCGENALAAELALKTLTAFRQNCAEFLQPFDGSGHGVKEYAWSASQFLELLIETIFGIDYCAEESLVTITPRLTPALTNEYLALKGIPLTEAVLLDVIIDHGMISCDVTGADLRVEVVEVFGK